MIICLSLVLSLPAQTESTIKQILDQTFVNSPAVKISKSRVDIQQGRFLSTQGIFNPELSFGLNKDYNLYPENIAIREGYLNNTPSASFDSDLLDYELALSKRFQFGMLVRPSVSLQNFGKNDLYESLRAAGYGDLITNRSSVFLDVTQPLLRGRGNKFYAAFMDIEELNLNAAELSYAFDVSNQTYAVLLNYITLIAQLQELEIQKSIENNYSEFARQLEILAEKDVIPKAELTFIYGNLNAQQASVRNTQTDVVAARNRLVESMGLDIESTSIPEILDSGFVFDSLKEIPGDGYLAYWLKKASEQRGDYLATQKRLASGMRSVEYAENANQATLDVSLGVGYHGIHESNGFDQFVAPHYSNIPGMSYRAGLIFKWPIGRSQSKGDLATALAEVDVAKYQLRSLELEIQRQISTSYTDIVNLDYAIKQRIKAVEYNKQALENEYLKLQLGTSAVVNLVQIQNNYAFSQTALNILEKSYKSALLKFRYESGTLIKINENNEILVNVEELFTLPETNASP